METLEALSASPALYTLAAGLLGLLVGSFLNVVIHRLPKMMEGEWRAQCAELAVMDAELGRPLRASRRPPGPLRPRSRPPRPRTTSSPPAPPAPSAARPSAPSRTSR
jgi:hypothetical protein